MTLVTFLANCRPSAFENTDCAHVEMQFTLAVIFLASEANEAIVRRGGLCSDCMARANPPSAARRLE
jgi:hypothetical protein